MYLKSMYDKEIYNCKKFSIRSNLINQKVFKVYNIVLNIS